MNSRIRAAVALLAFTALTALVPAISLSAFQPPPAATTATAPADPNNPFGAIDADMRSEIRHAFYRLPLAALLGAMLAVRPKRKGTPPRQPAVIQTQIILAVMAAVVMLVVGSNLARAFGVVGAAGLVRYRAKVEDNKDAGVMLSTLAVGLACGTGQYVIAVFSAFFILLVLWVIESFEPEAKKLFELTIKMGDDTDGRRKDIEGVLNRYQVDFTMLTSSDEQLSYEMHVPIELDRDRITKALLKLDPDGHAAIEWNEKKPKSK